MPSCVCEQMLTCWHVPFGAVCLCPPSERKAPTPKGRSVPQIISEFVSVRGLLSREPPFVNDKKLLTDAWLGNSL